jgi:SAM-dependent methyltransferase
VIGQLGDLSDKIVADLGAGSGYFAFRIVKKAKKLIAIDIDPSMIELLEDERSYYSDDIKSRFESRLATPDDPKLKESEVDVVLLVNTYPYIQDRINYFSRLRNSLKPGGLVMIVDFKKRNLPIGPDKEFKVALTAVEEELTQAGYKRIVSDDFSLAYQYIVKAYID